MRQKYRNIQRITKILHEIEFALNNRSLMFTYDTSSIDIEGIRTVFIFLL